jgi:hypothetical protein
MNLLQAAHAKEKLSTRKPLRNQTSTPHYNVSIRPSDCQHQKHQLIKNTLSKISITTNTIQKNKNNRQGSIIINPTEREETRTDRG